MEVSWFAFTYNLPAAPRQKITCFQLQWGIANFNNRPARHGRILFSFRIEETILAYRQTQRFYQLIKFFTDPSDSFS
jgi:hypothetical protein